MRSATKILGDEHHAILEIRRVFQTMAHQGEMTEPIPLPALADVHEFFTECAARSHHEKEEALRFPRLESKGVPRAGGPLWMHVE